MKRHTHHGLAGGLSVLLFALAGSAWAQNTAPTDPAHDPDTMGTMRAGHDDMSSMKGMHENMMGMHAMPATVNSVDTQTGVVDVNAGTMALKVHFPPQALTGLKAGDRITLHMGYSKP